MFGQTKFTIPQFPNFMDGRIETPVSRPRPRSPSVSQQVTKRPTSAALSERYSNKTYNRMPSPVNRWQPKTATEAPRPVGAKIGVPPSPAVGWAGAKTDDRASRLPIPVPKDRPRLQDQCSEDRDPVDDRVFVAVKKALSRAVLERGPIGERDIDTVLYDMRTRLHLSSSRSHATLAADGGRPLAGIVRKDLADVRPARSAYRRVYGGPRRSPSNRVIDDDPDTVLLIDLPDRDDGYLRLDAEKAERPGRCARSATHPGRADLEGSGSGENEDRPTCQAFAVGDQPGRSESFTVWKDSDETRLNRCISQLISKLLLRTDALPEPDHACRCQRKQEVEREPEMPRADPKPQVTRLRSSLASSARSSVGSKPPARPKAKFEVSRKTESTVFCPQPKAGHSLGTRNDLVSESEREPREEMYLQRRMRRSPVAGRS